jgi:diaminohydroxyphosphoribosylaminopyrimidine deaminase/5-amino-6-(5-phosphoribosylamino)uracil reductase
MTAPNPCVGAVLVRDGDIVAEGWHTGYGELHAEREALADARRKGVDPAQCTMYVTLEPCNHHGKTPPCTEGILEAGIRSVVVGTRDPNPVAAGGIEFLRENGVDVRVMEEDSQEGMACRGLLADFIHFQRSDRAYLILKLAATLDGKIAGVHGKQEKVTSPEAHVHVQALRGVAGAVIVGGRTLRADNPRLTRRGMETNGKTNQPYAVIVTTSLPAPDQDLYLLDSRAGQTIFWTGKDQAQSAAADQLRGLGCMVWGLEATKHGLDLAQGLSRLRNELDVYYTLCEGGGRLAMSCVEQGVADELHYIVAPRILGNVQGVGAFSGAAARDIAETKNFRITETGRFGPDLLLVLHPER